MPQALRSIPIRGPGRFGLNTSQAADTPDQRWALELTNAVFDDAGRIAARKGFAFTTNDAPHTDVSEQIHEYIKDKDTTEIIHTGDLSIWKGITTTTDITGTITTPTADNWQFRNFNGKVIGVQQGHVPIVYSGTSFANISGGENAPGNGNCVLCAWGRVWIADEDRKGIKASALLDETDYPESLDLQELWPDGQDLVVALEEWQDRLIVFGERNILIFINPDDIGAVSTTLALDDTVDSGLVGRDAVARVGNDVVYLSREGLRSLSRAIQYESLPASIISTNVRDRLVLDISTSSDYRLTYSETVGGILAKAGINYWYFDRKFPLETGDLRASQWVGIDWNAAHAATDGTIYLGGTGGIGRYEGFTDQGVTYTLRYRGNWIDAEGRTIIPKSSKTNVITSSSTTLSLTWAFDYSDAVKSADKGTGTSAVLAEWNVAEWNNSEWQSGGFDVRRAQYNLSGSGERIQMGLVIPITDEIAIAHIDLFYKLGRLAA